MALRARQVRLFTRHVLSCNLPALHNGCLFRQSLLHASRGFSILATGSLFPDSERFTSMKVPAYSVRSLFIQTEETPNPSSLKFLPGHEVLPAEFGKSMDFRKNESTKNSPLAKLLLRIDGVEGTFFGADFITITKSEEVTWAQLKPMVFATLMDFFAEGKPAVISAKEGEEEHEPSDDDDEIVELIKELLEERIRPMVQEDGGDILYKAFDPVTGMVTVKLAGSCVGCPSSTLTLKSGVENMLMHYIPEVKGVAEVLEDEDPNARKMSWTPSV